MSGQDLTRRGFIDRAGRTGLAAMVAAALPSVRGLALPPRAAADSPPGTVSDTDGTLQAFADTIIPGRKITQTETGAAVHPQAVLGADPRPGAVEADSLALYHDALIGFDALEPAFLADLERQALARAGGPFLGLDWAGRQATALAGYDFANPLRLVWEAAAAVPFEAFCGAGLAKTQTAADACGYRVMGLPGVAPNGYADFTYNRRLSRERTKTGSLA